ncbi:protein of unknown function (plasmid) [Cupriavidus taiwanensis]|uniref:Uncharacterized protein n=1 Tax=Cupriavidus taiwanensis TaxID=164546 RepID=A0A375II99_9BURK|nr:hypothetical protein CBM2592_B130043 [Cupriavidus taiwanensis]SOY66227.1 hypothetical protein CBM2588_B170043 [Cupriavidus taiwanensis]SOY94282.1 hypothetical protein CBM2591_B120043 [Cupriavidus taiwanensis]SOZ27885.1 hypothetical protein CBM2608_B130043 [Cupriavidus taiwanensis]SOZ70427.1 hypothetical protein CBM2617_B160042 [Cupriavidus taiwanensis]
MGDSGRQQQGAGSGGYGKTAEQHDGPGRKLRKAE